MSFNQGNLKEAESVPGAFPSEDAVMDTERDTNISQDPSLTGTNTTTGENADEKSREFLEQQKAAHTAGIESSDPATSGHPGHDEKATDFLEQQPAAHAAGGQKAEKYTPQFEENRSLPGNSQEASLSQQQTPQATSRPGQNSEAWTDVADPDTLLRRPGEEGSTTTGSRGLEAPGAGQQSANTQNAGQSDGSIGSNLATMATAVGLAAKDAFNAATDAAVPAASAATEQAKNLAGYAQENAAPAASYATEQAGNAAAYTRDTVAPGTSSGSTDTVPTGTALQTAGSAAAYAKDTAYSAANTAQSYAPNVLGEPSNTGSTARDTTSEVPRTVQESVTQAGKSPEAAANSHAVKDKARMEQELLGQSQTTQEQKKPHVDLTSRVKGLEEQLAPESMTPGVVTVLGTEQDRSFPLGETDKPVLT